MCQRRGRNRHGHSSGVKRATPPALIYRVNTDGRCFRQTTGEEHDARTGGRARNKTQLKRGSAKRLEPHGKTKRTALARPRSQ
jgi:hypothetical protein